MNENWLGEFVVKILNDITDFIFVEDSVSEMWEADIIFISGSSKYQLPELASKLYTQGLAKILLPSGKYSSKNNRFVVENTKNTKYEGNYETDWDFCKQVLIKNGVPENKFWKKINQQILMRMDYFLKRY